MFWNSTFNYIFQKKSHDSLENTTDGFHLSEVKSAFGVQLQTKNGLSRTPFSRDKEIPSRKPVANKFQ